MQFASPCPTFARLRSVQRAPARPPGLPAYAIRQFAQFAELSGIREDPSALALIERALRAMLVPRRPCPQSVSDASGRPAGSSRSMTARQRSNEPAETASAASG